MATQLTVYREAGRLLGDYRFAGLTDDSTARYAFDDAWDAVVEYVLGSAFWRFTLRTEVPQASVVAPLPGYAYCYDLPCDGSRLHAIFQTDAALPGMECPVDVKHQLEQIHTNIADPQVRYVSDDYADPDTWPEHFAHAVAVRLAAVTAERVTGNPAKLEQMLQLWNVAMQQALAGYAVPEDSWLRHQLAGTFLPGVKWLLDEAFWRFAVKTVSLTGSTTGVSAGYSYAVAKPADWGRTFQLYYPVGTDRCDIDYRDENGALHSQYQNTVLRYVSADGENSTTWSDGFRRALLAYLELEEAKRNPQTAGAVLQARMLAWTEAFKNARIKDDMAEKPKLNNVGRLVQSRRRFGSSMAREQGW